VAGQPDDTDRTSVPDKALDDALSSGARDELPPNQPKGILGDKGLDIYKVDTFEPDLNAGVSQENDAPVIHLAIVLAYLLFFPLAFWLLWRSPLYSVRAKVTLTIAGVTGVVVVGFALLRG